MPPWLPPKAKTFWKKLCIWLESLGVLAETDAFEMEAFALTYCLWRDTYLEVKRKGTTYNVTNRDGNTLKKANPAAKIMLEYHRELLKLAQQFGLTPSARAGLSIDRGAPVGSQDSPFESPAGRKRQSRTKKKGRSRAAG